MDAENYILIFEVLFFFLSPQKIFKEVSYIEEKFLLNFHFSFVFYYFLIYVLVIKRNQNMVNNKHAYCSL